MEGNFTFYPVGQGCFYGGVIHYNKEEFVVVYDCGTVSKSEYLNNSIDEFKLRYGKIDLLMISHFDKDHVSGLESLLTGIACKRVIIPYYLPILRLALFGNNDYDDEYTSFIKDPISYLLNTEKFNVEEVIVLENGNEDGNDIVKAPLPKEPSDNQKIVEEKLKGENSKFKNRAIKNEGPEFSPSNKVKFLTLPLKLSIPNGLWEFVFYLKDFRNPAGLINFENGINNLLAKTKDGKLSSLFENTFIVNIKTLYKKHIASNINYTSLVVYHGPIKTDVNAEMYLHCFFHWWPHFEPMKTLGTLLTGDSFLKKLEDFNPFYNYYSPYYIDNCFLFQVPHHGSEKNWNNLPNGLERIPFYIINHGWGRKHPYQSVIDNIISNSNVKIISNNESSKIEYTIIVRHK